MSKKEFSYKVRIEAETEALSKKMATVKESLRSVLASGKAPGVEKTFEEIERALGRLQQKTAQPIDSMAAFKGLEKEATSIGLSLTKLGKQITDLRNLSKEDKLELMDESTRKKVEGIQKALEAYETTISKVSQASKDLAKVDEDLIIAEQDLKKASEKASDKKQLVEIQKKAVDEANAEKKAIYEKLTALKKYQETLAAYEKAEEHKGAKGDSKSNEGKNLGNLNLPADKKAAQAAMPELDLESAKDVSAAIEELSTKHSQASKAVTDATAVYRKYDKQMQETANASSLAQTKVDNLKASQAQLQIDAANKEVENAAKAYTDLRNAAIKLDESFKNIPIEYTKENLAQLQKKLEQTKAEGFDKVVSGCNSAETQLTETTEASDKMKESLERNKQTAKELDDRMNQTQAFANRIKQFVGIEGAARLARRAFQDAFKTIKELDAAMTEMAVVTELDVGDYWDKLPEYTARANALGVSIKSAYQSATLYYQQGLKTNEVVAMSNETLKMARIAGLSAEEATNKMTAALRGFNMELNETSAQKISDVYSKLAAITASDVNEISTAMTKTASIAASAGMEFETTAAFLSQIIETTRESAETAGTAMKTVIARFQELKKDPAEIGEVDGEIVDANKIETALRSVGVSLRDTSGQFRELDDVFLELSGKWGTLDTNTQRYIATIAAGSRQQSRFIAMMSDYSRTQELVSAANNSAGASNEQFEKTLESLDAKLNQLKNSWDTFTMSLVDNAILKTGIDILTQLMTTINGVIALFDKIGLGGAASVGMVVGALILGTKALNAFELNMRATDANGKKLYTTLGAIGQTGKQAFKSISNGIKQLPQKIQQTNLGAAKLNAELRLAFSKKTTKAAADYRSALSQLSTAQNAYNVAAFSGRTTTEQVAAADARVIASRTALGNAEAALAAQMGLTTAQQTVANSMKIAGVGYENALILAKSGLTMAQLQEMASTNGVTVAEQAEMLVKNANTKSTLMQTLATFLLTSAQKLQEGGLKGLIKYWWSSLSAKFADIGATWAQVAANLGLQASMWPILLIGLLIIAAIAVLVAGIVLLIKLFKSIKANSPEGKLAASKEAAEAAGKAAEEAATAYNDLVDAFDSLSDKYDALDDLTEGTREWRDAVKEINGEVMDLVEQYPELASLVTSENGVLTLDIESDEVQAVLDSYEQKSIQASSAEMAAKMEVIEKQRVVDYKNLSNGAELGSQFLTGAGYAASGALMASGHPLLTAVGGMGMAATATKQAKDKQNTEAMAKALADGLILEGDNGWEVTDEAALEALGLTAEEARRFAEELGDNAEELKKYGETVNALDAQQKALLESMAMNAVQMVDTTEMSTEEIQQVNAAADANFAKTIQDNELARLEELDKTDFKAEAEKVAKEMYGEDATVKDNGDVVYKDADGNEKTIKRDQFEDQVAAANSSKLMANALEDLPDAIDSVAGKMGKAGKAFERTYTAKEGKGLTKADVASLKEVSDTELEEIYESLTAEEKAAFGSLENFKNHIQESIDLSTKAFEKANKTIEEMGVSVELHGKMTSEAAQGYADQLVDIAGTSGQEGVDAVNNTINAIAENMSDEEFTKFMAQINSLDWKNMDDLENLPETLAELGISVPAEELQNFIDTAQDAAGAIKKIDLDKLNEQMQQLASIASKIDSNEQGRNFSESDYNALVAADGDLANDFRQNLDGEWVYVGESMDTLRAAIEENTAALLGEATKQLQTKVGASGIMEDMGKSSSYGEISRWAEWDDSKSRDWLAEFIARAKGEGYDLTQLGIAGLSNETEAMKISEEKLTEIMTNLHTVFAQTATNTELLNEKLANAAALSFQNDDPTKNSAEASGYRRAAMNRELSDSEFMNLQERQNALAMQAQAAGIDEITISNYTKAIAEINRMIEAGETGTQAYKDLVEQVEILEVTLTNATSLSQMNEQFTRTISTITELNDKMKQATDWDTKLIYLSNAVAGFGIDVYKMTKAEQEHLMTLLNTMVQGGTEGYLAMDQMLILAAQSMGITMEELALMGTMTWAEMLETNQTNLIRFVEMVEDLGIAKWFDLPDGSGSTLQYITPGQYQTNIQEAGGEENWESTYNYMYNYNEQINALIREREKLERAYQRAVEDSTKSAKELKEIMSGEIGNLSEQIDMYQAGITKAQSSIQELFTKNPEFAKYVSFDATTGTIKIDDTALSKVNWSQEKGEKFENFLAALEENRDVIVEGLEALEDIEDQVIELKKRTREQASNLYESVKEGLVKERQDEIDKLSEINDSINEAQSKLVDQIQKQIDDARQARENEKTEQSIADKEARLAYLMRDTSGNHTAEILGLQKDLDEEKQGYADSLVDQKLNDLSEANEVAAEQRERQIALMQAQLDAYSNSQTIWNDVKAILDESYAQAAAAVASGKTWDEAWNATQAGRFQNIAADTATLNPVAREIQLEDNAKEAAQAQLYLDKESDLWTKINDVETKIETAKDAINTANQNLNNTTNTNLTEGTELVKGSMNNVGGKVDNAARTISSAIQQQTGVLSGALGSVMSRLEETEKSQDKEKARQEAQDYINSKGWTESSRSFWKNDSGFAKKLAAYEALGGSMADLKGVAEPTKKTTSTSKFKKGDKIKSKEQTQDGGVNQVRSWWKEGTNTFKTNVFYWEFGSSLNGDTIAEGPVKGSDGYTYYRIPCAYDNEWFREDQLLKYETGGLANFTGPAWLDGTKSSPELVLNSTDTRNFIMLKDILGDILSGTSTIKRQSDTDTKGGDNYYEIEINVDSLNEDYDVEQLADKIKSMIYEDSVYRNVNTVHLIR